MNNLSKAEKLRLYRAIQKAVDGLNFSYWPKGMVKKISRKSEISFAIKTKMRLMYKNSLRYNSLEEAIQSLFNSRNLVAQAKQALLDKRDYLEARIAQKLRSDGKVPEEIIEDASGVIAMEMIKNNRLPEDLDNFNVDSYIEDMLSSMDIKVIRDPKPESSESRDFEINPN